ncbi:lipase 3-like [Periplaneta americana]|uniref:lipase 3-like n=1 Tax=Periplaneta americana TaxID=6978 RepID=UPI0037E7221D
MTSGFLFVLCIGHFISSEGSSLLTRIEQKPPDDYLSDVILSTPQLIQKYGYPLEEHTVQTEDGYLLTHFRIPYGRNNPDLAGGPPVILQHGLLLASDIWLLEGEEKSLGFVMADAGYDVWLTNSRGNRHSNRHVNLTTNTGKFWNFSYHEMGYYDMPATIDYIRATIGEQKVHYIGHSMGATMLFVMLSMRPEYNDKVRLGISLAPVVFLWEPKSLLINFLVPNIKQLEGVLNLAKVWQLFPYNQKLAREIANYCEESSHQEICLQVYKLYYGDNTQLNKTLLPAIAAHHSSGGSTKTVFHFFQMFVTGLFQQYDYGPQENIKHYGHPEPPAYDLRNVTAPMSLHYGEKDLFVNPEGVRHLAEQLFNVAAMSMGSPISFNHIDFILGKDAKGRVFEDVVARMAVY